MNNERIAWLAGILDGEGCIRACFTNKGRYQSNPSGNLHYKVEIYSTSARMVDEIEKIYAAIGIDYRRYPPRMQNKSTRPAHKIVVQRKRSVRDLLNLAIPHMRVKDLEARKIIDFLATNFREYGETRSSHEARIALVSVVRDLKKVA